jgi:hypothetical protein
MKQQLIHIHYLKPKKNSSALRIDEAHLSSIPISKAAKHQKRSVSNYSNPPTWPEFTLTMCTELSFEPLTIVWESKVTDKHVNPSV